MNSGNLYVPERGDLVWLSFDPRIGHEQSGKRPAIVISSVDYNRKVGLALFCPITSKKKKYPFEVEICAKKIDGVILSDQVKSLDWRERKAKFICKSEKTTMVQVIEKLKLLMEIENTD